jgi:hypothetical protein
VEIDDGPGGEAWDPRVADVFNGNREIAESGLTSADSFEKASGQAGS